MSSTDEIPFEKVIDGLTDMKAPVPARLIRRLSDLEQSEVSQIQPIWSGIPLKRRLSIMEEIEQLSGDDYLLDFVAISTMALEDENPHVRLLAVHALWEYEEDGLIPVFISLLNKDVDDDVRAAAAGALSRFVYAGEIESISSKKLKDVEDTLLLALERDKAPKVQRASLESLGFSSREEISPLIQRAYDSKDRSWQSSALLAMGRSANSIWQPAVLAMLENTYPALRTEAARAAGELEMKEALPFLMEMIEDPDDNARMASIWSLSQIGGEEVREKIEALYEEAEDDEELEFLESALDNLSFTEGVKLMPFFDFAEDEHEEDDEADWLDEMDEMEDLFDDEEDLVD